MAKYRKTALVDAEQFLPAENKIPAGVRSSGMGDPRKGGDCDWVLDTLEGTHTLRGGDYICTGPAGERWNVACEIFEATYEPASDAAAPLYLPVQSVEGEVVACARRVVEDMTQDATGRWFLGGNDPEMTIVALADALDDAPPKPSETPAMGWKITDETVERFRAWYFAYTRKRLFDRNARTALTAILAASTPESAS